MRWVVNTGSAERVSGVDGLVFGGDGKSVLDAGFCHLGLYASWIRGVVLGLDGFGTGCRGWFVDWGCVPDMT